MEAPQGKRSKLLPANAYTKLKDGEVYKPIVPPEDGRAEVTRWSISLGVIMVVIFTAAASYISLRAGNGIEASIPIAILAIFFGVLRKVKSTILENVMVQSVGQASGVVAAGATFVVPALYINELNATWWQIFLACCIGGFLGTVLIIPLRKYFVKDLHGELPFPEATAINEVLVTGESAAGGAGKILILSFLLGAAFDFAIEGCHLWNPDLTTDALPGGLGEYLANIRIEIQVLGIAALFGLGYIIGMKYASIIAAGSLLAFVVLVPLTYQFGKVAGDFTYAGKTFNLSVMNAGAIFASFIKPIGIGAIAISGLIGILRMWKIVAGSVSLGFKGLSKKGRADAETERTQQDMHPKNVLLIQLLATLGMGFLFFIVALTTKEADGTTYGVGSAVLFAVVGMVAGFVLSFLFTPVAAQAIAIVGVNPVSGMTLITVVLAIGALIMVGLKGQAGMIIALVVGTAVCTALSTSGALISDFKVGYWIGSTPRNQQIWKFLGVVVAALVVALVIPLMDSAYQFLINDPVTGMLVPNDKVLPAPQGNMIAAVSRGLMDDPANQPWMLYGLGGVVAFLLMMAGVPMLAFALGMYLPIFINISVLTGALCSWIVSKTGKNEKVRKARTAQGPLIASGLMAGAALFGIFTAVLRLPNIDAPIRYISAGKDYQLEAVVEGSVVKKGGKVISSCAVAIKDCGTKDSCNMLVQPNQKCNELLKPIKYQEDDKGRPVYDEGLLTEVQRRSAEIRDHIRKIAASGPIAIQLKMDLLGSAERLTANISKLQKGEPLVQPLVGARSLMRNAAGFSRVVNVRVEQIKKAAKDAKKAAVGAAQLAAKLKTAEADEKDAKARKLAQELADKAKLAQKDRDTLLKTSHDIDRLHHNLHPKYRHPWYEGNIGRGIGLLMIVGLCFGCFLLARLGARWEMEQSGDDGDEAAEDVGGEE